MASGTLAVGGLMSGIDTESMFAQLREAYRKPVELMEERKNDYNVKLSAYSTLQAKLTALRTSAKEMDTSGEFTSLSATSTDENVLTATATSTAKSMAYNLQITALAQAHKVATSSTYSSTETLVDVDQTATMTIQVGNGTAKSVVIDHANSTVQGIADKINDTDGIDVVAATVYDGSKYKLMISSKEEGDENIVNISIDEGTGTASDNIDSTGLSQLAYDNFKSTVAASYDTFYTDTETNGRVVINNEFSVLVTSTDTMQDIVDKINDDANWYNTDGTALLDTDDKADLTKAKAVVVTDLSQSGKSFIRADGVTTWEALSSKTVTVGNPVADTAITGLAIDTTYMQNNMYFQTDVSYDVTLPGVYQAGAGENLTFNSHVGGYDTLANDELGDIRDGVDGDGAGGVENQVTATIVTDPSNSDNAFLRVDNVNSFSVNSNYDGLMYVKSKNMTRSQYGQDSTVIIDGTTIKRSSNTIDDMLTGLTLNIKKSSYNTETEVYDTLTLNVAKDSTKMIEKFEAVTEAYNDLIDFFEEYQGVQLAEDESSKTLEESMGELMSILSGDEVEDDDDSPIKYGPLMGDSTTSLVKSKLFNLSFADVSGVDSSYNNLTEMGISLNFGKMSIDKEIFTEALSANSDAIIQFFTNDTTSSEGFITKLIDSIDNMVENYAGNSKGILLARQDGIQSTIDRLDEQILTQDARIEAELERTRAQFNSLEVLMGQYQTTSSYLASQLAAMAG